MERKTPGLWLAVAVAGYCALWLLVPKATFLPAIVNLMRKLQPDAHPAAALLMHLSSLMLIAAPTVVFMAVQVGIVYCFARVRMNWWQAVLALVTSLAGLTLIVALMVWQSGIVAKLHRSLTLREIFYFMGVYSHWLKMPMFLMIMLAAASVGYLVSLRVKDKNLILPVVMFAAYIDAWTVTRGPVSAVLQNAPEVVNAVAAPIPAAGTGAFVPVSMVGPGDFLFMGLVFAAVHRLEMNGSRNYWFVTIAMALGMLAVVRGWFGLDFLPALIVLGIGVAAANWREFKLTRQEAISMAIVGAVLAASLPLVWSLIGSKETAEPKKPQVKNTKAAKHRPVPQAPSKADR